MEVLDFFLSFLLSLFLIAGVCYLFGFRIKAFTFLGLNAIAGLNLTLILSIFHVCTLTGISGFLSSILGPAGTLINLTTTCFFC